MKCQNCKKKAVFSNPHYCKAHFIEYIESKVLRAIKDFKLLDKKDRIAVAVSGGKDSLTVLHIISKHYGDVVALAIDEGIKGYREHTLADLKRFCKKHSIGLEVHSMEEDYGTTLDVLLKKADEKPCTVCGAIRRSMINHHARDLKATKLATGHNMDDEAQSILMNFFKNQLSISARLGPKSGIAEDKSFIPRVKPLYFCTEKEIMAYAYLMGFGVGFTECPYAHESYRSHVQKLLNRYEAEHPGTKKNIIGNFLKILPLLKEHYRTCESQGLCRQCGEPSRSPVCKTCRILEKGR